MNKAVKVRWVRHVACIAYMRNAYKILRHSEALRPTWDTLTYRRWEDNIKMSLKEIVWEGLDLIEHAQDMGPEEVEYVNMVMKHVPKRWGIF